MFRRVGVTGTRIMVQGILDNATDFTAEQIAGEIFAPCRRICRSSMQLWFYAA